ARVGLFDKPDDLLGAESALLHVRPLGFTDFIASAGTAQWGQVIMAVAGVRLFLVHFTSRAWVQLPWLLAALIGGIRTVECGWKKQSVRGYIPRSWKRSFHMEHHQL
ncbi:hypothetical protein, partial [Xanthomonas perforans]|uniref:hypothetical protein n=1 Tax=Xanthomonas perforans TaxID=442694 RepID=UPI001F1A820A